MEQTSDKLKRDYHLRGEAEGVGYLQDVDQL
jgi:hypothetical protein